MQTNNVGEEPVHINRRRRLNDGFPAGYLESDKEYVMNNLAACVRYLDAQSEADTEVKTRFEPL